MLVQHFATHFDHFQKCVFPVLKSWHLLEARHITLFLSGIWNGCTQDQIIVVWIQCISQETLVKSHRLECNHLAMVEGVGRIPCCLDVLQLSKFYWVVNDHCICFKFPCNVVFSPILSGVARSFFIWYLLFVLPNSPVHCMKLPSQSIILCFRLYFLRVFAFLVCIYVSCLYLYFLNVFVLPVCSFSSIALPSLTRCTMGSLRTCCTWGSFNISRS